MKPPPFRYWAPTTVEEATAALAESSDQAAGGHPKVLAGGQSLIPLLNMRLLAPSGLVDINGIDTLGGVEVDATGGVRIGARVRQAELERHAQARAANPLLALALPLVAHPVIRNRGTVVGSITHADPAAELPAVLALTGGTVELVAAGRPGERIVPANEFFVAPLESDVRPGELATAVRFGPVPQGAGCAFVEMTRRHGDYALCGIAAIVERADGTVIRARIATVSVHPTPLVVDVTSFLAEGVDDAGLHAAGNHVAASVEAEADLHATVDYRLHLTRVLTSRALGTAVRRGQLKDSA